MSKNPVWAANAAYARANKTQDPEIIARAKGDVHAATLQVAIEKAIAAAPPISAEAREKLAALLIGGKK